MSSYDVMLFGAITTVSLIAIAELFKAFKHNKLRLEIPSKTPATIHRTISISSFTQDDGSKLQHPLHVITDENITNFDSNLLTVFDVLKDDFTNYILNQNSYDNYKTQNIPSKFFQNMDSNWKKFFHVPISKHEQREMFFIHYAQKMRVCGISIPKGMLKKIKCESFKRKHKYSFIILACKQFIFIYTILSKDEDSLQNFKNDVLSKIKQIKQTSTKDNTLCFISYRKMNNNQTPEQRSIDVDGYDPLGNDLYVSFDRNIWMKVQRDNHFAFVMNNDNIKRRRRRHIDNAMFTLGLPEDINTDNYKRNYTDDEEEEIDTEDAHTTATTATDDVLGEFRDSLTNLHFTDQ